MSSESGERRGGTQSFTSSWEMNWEKVEILQGDMEMRSEYPLIPCPRTHPPQAWFCGEEVRNKNENISGMNQELREKEGGAE